MLLTFVPARDLTSSVGRSDFVRLFWRTFAAPDVEGMTFYKAEKTRSPHEIFEEVSVMTSRNLGCVLAHRGKWQRLVDSGPCT